MSIPKHKTYCTKCKDYTIDDISEASYHRQGEDTYDFQLCNKHELELWKFLGEEATFSWQRCPDCDEHEDECECGGDES